MADVCLWSEDYDGSIEYANQLINATATRRPVFMAVPEQWITIFTQGNSNESIFEINWDEKNFAQQEENKGTSPSYYFTLSTTAPYLYTEAMCEDLYNESIENGAGDITAYVLNGEHMQTWMQQEQQIKNSIASGNTKDRNIRI